MPRPAPRHLAPALLVVLFTCAAAAAAVAAAAPRAAAQPSIWKKLTPTAGPIAAQVQAEVETAKAKHLSPFVYLGAGWCDPCVAIKRSLNDPKMRDALKGTYIIELEVDEWDEKELKALDYRLGTIPYFSELDARGHGTGRSINGGAWGENTPENMAPPLKRFFARR
jgi:hypothetical protein